MFHPTLNENVYRSLLSRINGIERGLGGYATVVVSSGWASSWSHARSRTDTRFFLYKNLVYKNVQAEICPKIKNIIRTWPASNFLTRFANEQEQKGIKTNKQLFDHISYYIYSPLDNCMEGVD